MAKIVTYKDEFGNMKKIVTDYVLVSDVSDIPETGTITKILLDNIIRMFCKHQNKIEAIKITRYYSNLGLKEAKDYVEYVEAL